MALALVILCTMVVLGVLLAGLQLASANALQVGTTYRRHLARCAAEAGVHLAMHRLETQPAFRGRLDGVLAGSGAAWSVTVEPGPTEGQLLVRADGRDRPDGPYRRRLEVIVQPATESFNALTTEGLIRTSGNTFVNAVRGLRAPVPEPGHLHTNAASAGAIDGTGRLTLTGLASTPGTVGEVVARDKRRNGAQVKSPERPRREDLLDGEFRTGSIPDTGEVGGRLRVATSALHHGPLHLQDGAVLHVQGHLVVEGGITGQGTVVTDGNLELRGAPEPDLENTRGVVLYSEGDVVIADPSTQRVQAEPGEEGRYTAAPDPVRDWFARMPATAPYALAQDLPLDAPGGAAFFDWYANQSRQPSESFTAWRDGVSSKTEPRSGLPEDVRTWLDECVPLQDQIRTWGTGS